MKFGYTIIYVDDVSATLAFFEKAFGLKTRFIHESGYGELDTGATTLAFASHQLAQQNLPNGYIESKLSVQPLGIEIALVTEFVQEAYQRAISAGALPLKEPTQKPWGQIVSYVQSPDGVLVELCSPVNG